MTNWEKEQDYLNSHGVSTIDVPTDVFEWVKTNSFKAKEDKNLHNSELVGHMKEEYLIKEKPPKSVFGFITRQALEGPFFRDVLRGVSVLTHDVPIVVDSLWVNFQKKYEFNPIHNHSGFASFIIFVNIPYDLKEEEDYFKVIHQSSIKHTSKLAFLNYQPHDGVVYPKPINVDKSFEGKMLMFSNKHLHMVYPFYTSDGYRITISGNLKFDTSGLQA